MATEVAELEADCAELRELHGRAERRSVRRELQRVLDVLEAELQRTKAASGTSAAVPSPAATTPAGAASSTAPPAAPSTAAASAASAATDTPDPKAPAAASTSAAQATPVPAAVSVKPTGPWTEVTTFALDLGGYSGPTVSVDVRLKGVEQLPAERVTCDFTEASFDLKVIDLDGQNYRFLKTNLDKDIVPAESSVKVKKNHVIISLQKVKGQYGYDSWSDLCAKGRRKPTAASANKEGSNPQDSIMDMMKDLYEDGDDNMKKIIGEAMYKAQRGEKYEPKTDDFKPPAAGGLDDI